MDKQAGYLAGHIACGLKIGDWVRIDKKAESQESGWGENWTDSKNIFIGRTYRIGKDHQYFGFSMAGDEMEWRFPWFVLTQVDPPAAQKAAPPVFGVGDEVEIVGPMGPLCENRMSTMGDICHIDNIDLDDVRPDFHYHMVEGAWYPASSLRFIRKATPTPTDAEEIRRIVEEIGGCIDGCGAELKRAVTRLVEYLDRRDK